MDLHEIDALASAGRLPEAAARLEALLGDAALAAADAPQLWMRLAGLRRAMRQPRRALEAVHHALEHDPLDFMALVVRAGLLERLADPAAGPAWAEAIAQKPQGELPGPLSSALAAGEAFHAGWMAAREARMTAATASITASGGESAEQDPDEAWRLARFRSNILRRTRVYHSEPTHFHYPGLVEREFHPRAAAPWLPELESAFADIREEMTALLRSERAALEPYIRYEDREALAQWRALNQSKDWSALHLIRQGEVVTQNAALAPRTMDMLARLPQPQVPGASPNAMFSLLAPRTAIPPHVGVDNTRLVCHLPLVVPEGCWFRVGAETRSWREGEALVFDDTIEHEAMNPSDALRVVLIFDVWHPGLSPAERAGIAATIAADGST